MPSFSGNVLLAYRDRYPNVHVSAHDVVHEPVVDMVERGVVELGIGFEPDSRARVHFTPLFTDRFVAVVPASSPLVAQGSLDWTNLLSYGFIALQRPSSVRRLLEQRLGNRPAGGLGVPPARDRRPDGGGGPWSQRSASALQAADECVGREVSRSEGAGHQA